MEITPIADWLLAFSENSCSCFWGRLASSEGQNGPHFCPGYSAEATILPNAKGMDIIQNSSSMFFEGLDNSLC